MLIFLGCDGTSRKYQAYCQEHVDAICAHAVWHAGVIVYFPCGTAGIRRGRLWYIQCCWRSGGDVLHDF